MWKKTLVATLLIVCVVGIIGCGESKSETNAVDTTTKPETTTQQETTTQSETTPSQTTNTGQTVFQDSGTAGMAGDKDTSTFHLGSGQKALKYTVTAGGDKPMLMLFSVTLKPAGFEGYLDSLTGPIGESGSGEIPIYESEGDYYLFIQASYCTWSVTIVESK